MHMDTKNLRYRAEMEVLCSLPRMPHTARVENIALDMGESAYVVHNLLAKLRGLGYRLTEYVDDGRDVVAIADEGWISARRNGRKYWHKVYGGYSVAG